MEIDQSLVIKDENGDPKIFLHAHSKLSTISVVGDDRAEIMLEGGKGRLAVRVRASDGHDLLIFAVREELTTVLLRDEQGRTRIQLTCTRPDMKATCTVRDADGQETAQFDLLSHGTA